MFMKQRTRDLLLKIAEIVENKSEKKLLGGQSRLYRTEASMFMKQQTRDLLLKIAEVV